MFSVIANTSFAKVYSNAVDMTGGYMYDCSRGMTIDVSKVWVYAKPRSTYYYDQVYTLTGGDGPKGTCASNIKVITWSGGSVAK